MKKSNVLSVLSVFLTAFLLALCFLLVSCDLGILKKDKDEESCSIIFRTGEGGGYPPSHNDVGRGYRLQLPGQGNMTHSAEKVLSGWKCNIDNSIHNAFDIYIVNSDVEFIAQWAWATTPPTDPEPQMYYEITYYPNGGYGTPPGKQREIAGSSITIPSGSGLSRSGYAFGGWNTLRNGYGETYKTGDRIVVTKDIDLYAIWVMTSKTYTLGTEVYSGWLDGNFSDYKTIDDISSVYKADFVFSRLKSLGYTKVTFQYIYSMDIKGKMDYKLRLYNVNTSTTLGQSNEYNPGDGATINNRSDQFSTDLSRLEDYHTLEIQASYRKRKNWLGIDEWFGESWIKPNRKLTVTFW